MFPLDGAACGEYLIGKEFRRIGFRLRVIYIRSYLELFQSVSTIATEFISRQVLTAALRACIRKLHPAFTAELSCIRISRLAIRALHSFSVWESCALITGGDIVVDDEPIVNGLSYKALKIEAP